MGIARNVSEIKEGKINFACYKLSETLVHARFEPRLLTVSWDDSQSVSDLTYKLADMINLASHGCARMYGRDSSEHESAVARLKVGEIDISINPQSSNFHPKYVGDMCVAVMRFLTTYARR
ncbi:hypothetical protein FWF93_02960 [Candidatus Saccharibacteria bacterium]|nr:hypothetical protein [Candidatus Saccharibacteria bacterium]